MRIASLYCGHSSGRFLFAFRVQARIAIHPRLALLSAEKAAATPAFTAAELLQAVRPLLADITVTEHTGQAAVEFGRGSSRGPTSRSRYETGGRCAPMSPRPADVTCTVPLRCM